MSKSKLPMNLPNRITLARVALLPVYFVLLSLNPGARNWPAALVFAIAAISDFVDGSIARKRGLVTDFGKFMDPIADKLLVLLPFIYLLPSGGPLDVWAVLIMVARELVVSGFRLVAAGKKVVIAADWSGKIKTIAQMIAVLLLTLGFAWGWPVAWGAAFLSAFSGAEILIRNRRVLEEGP